MKYFHRTTLSPDAALDAAKGFFGSRMAPAEESPRRRALAGPLGKVTVAARAEGGHYTFIEVGTDQVGESEIDRLARRLLAELHRQGEASPELPRAYHPARLAPYPGRSTAGTNSLVVPGSAV